MKQASLAKPRWECCDVTRKSVYWSNSWKKRCVIHYLKAPSIRLWHRNWSCERFLSVVFLESWQKIFVTHRLWQQSISSPGTWKRENYSLTASWYAIKPGYHPAYSPDTAPSNCYLISGLKSDLGGWCFDTTTALQKYVTQYFKILDTEYFSRSICKLVEPYE